VRVEVRDKEFQDAVMFRFNRCRAGATLIVALGVFPASLVSATAQQLAPFAPARTPFTASLSNNTPLAFGMDLEDAARALGSLNYISGRPGNEIFLAYRHGGGSVFFPRKDRLYLQFRSGRLTGWKGDWGSRWIWQ
jgi:hypothetical protein